MFSWVCPNCSREVSPSLSECPNCAAAAKAKAPDTPIDTVPVAVTPPPTRTAPPARSGNLPGWLVSAFVAAGLVGVLAILYLFILPSRRGASADVAPTSSAPPAGAVSQLARHIEITGLRVTGNARQTTKVQFVAVNHSGASLPDLGLQISVQNAAGEPVIEFPFTLPSLGPYESGEYSTAVKTKMRSYEMPDWQMVKASFAITSQP